MAMGDPAIEEIYTLARAARNRIYVLVLPARKSPDPKVGFWKQIYAINARFAKTRRLPAVTITAKGEYRVR